MNRKQSLRIIILFVFSIVIIRLFYWQVIDSVNLQQVAQAQYQHTAVLGVSRGKIISADGYPLVVNQQVFDLFATPKVFKDSTERIATLVSSLLPPPNSTDTAVPNPQLRTQAILSKIQSTDRSWVLLAKHISPDTKNSISALNITGLGFDPSQIRYYPEASMAAHILGFVGSNSQGQPQGYFGLEGKYDLELKGKNGVISEQTDALGHPMLLGSTDKIDSITGRDIYITIRRDLQNMLEQKLQEGMQKYGAKAADAIIMEPSTGKIMAMASLPNYDPRFYSSQDQNLYKNPMIADGYEPGSTFKVVTVAAGIDANVISPDTQCDDCGAPKVIGKYTIRTWNDQYQKNITMTDALVHSDNTAMMFVVKKLGKQSFLQYVQKFGFGQKTGIDLQEEASPPLRNLNSWGDIDIATGSFGQGIAVTGIQILNAVNVVANNGVMVKPMVVERVSSDQGDYVIHPTIEGQIIKPETAKLVTEMMIEAAKRGDAKWALPKGYLIAGKTGTAQIPINGHYDAQRTIASFIGFAPADHPLFTMLVRLVDPQTSQWGSETAAPLWFNISRELFLKMGIMPSVQ